MPKLVISVDDNKLKRYLLNTRRRFKYIYMGATKDEHIVNSLHKNGSSEIEEMSVDAGLKRYFCKEYIDLIGRLGTKYNSVYWWTTFVSSKNRVASRLNDNLFSLYSTANKIKRYKDCDILIVASDSLILKSLKRYLQDYNFELVIFESRIKQFKDVVLANVKCVISAMLFIARTWRKIYISRYYLGKALKTSISGRTYYVIKTFVYNTSFDNNGNYRDSFFGALPEYLKNKKKSVMIFADILGDYKLILRNVQLNKTSVIVPLEYLISYADPIKAVFKTFAKRVVIEKGEKFLDFNISDLINSAILKDYKKGCIGFHYLYFIYVKKLIALINIETFTFTYENNPWERLCMAALRKYSPSTKIIGYQHSVVPEASANMFLSKFERNVIPLPDKILTVGIITKEIMERYGAYTKGHIEEACALRFEYLFNASPRPRVKSGRILIALEGLYEVSRLVNYVFREMKDIKDFDIKIRTHPVLPFSHLRNEIKYDIEDLSHISLSKNPPVKEDIENADIVVYWGSTVALEALVIGKPLIHFDMQTILSYDPLFENSYLKWTVSENESLHATIKEIYATSDDLFYVQQQKAREYLKKYFYPVEEEGLQKFLA